MAFINIFPFPRCSLTRSVEDVKYSSGYIGDTRQIDEIIHYVDYDVIFTYALV